MSAPHRAALYARCSSLKQADRDLAVERLEVEPDGRVRFAMKRTFEGRTVALWTMMPLMPTHLVTSRQDFGGQMKKDEVGRIVAEMARTLHDEGALADGTYIVNPMVVWNELRVRRPDVANHIARHYSGDPYQQTKVWIPYRAR